MANLLRGRHHHNSLRNRARNGRNSRRVGVLTRTLADDREMTNRLVAGMVGGGPGAMIGAAHRHAMWLDNQYVLAAGIFGRDPASSAEFAHRIGVERVYEDYRQMAQREAERADGVDVVAVVTPNESHFEIARAFLEADISVVCEKPLTNDSDSAAELVAIAESHQAILAVPHIYSAYAVVRHAARMVRNGELGRIRFVAAEHASGWASAQVDQWRMDPERGGVATAVADVAPTRFICCATSPGWKPSASRPNSPHLSPDDRCSTTRPCGSRCPTAHPQPCGRPWRPPATSTDSGSGCSVTTRAWSGATRIP